VKFESTTTLYFPPGTTPSVPPKTGNNFCTGPKADVELRPGETKRVSLGEAAAQAQ
jgi:hypothetical protein